MSQPSRNAHSEASTTPSTRTVTVPPLSSFLKEDEPGSKMPTICTTKAKTKLSKNYPGVFETRSITIPTFYLNDEGSSISFERDHLHTHEVSPTTTSSRGQSALRKVFSGDGLKTVTKKFLESQGYTLGGLTSDTNIEILVNEPPSDIDHNPGDTDVLTANATDITQFYKLLIETVQARSSLATYAKVNCQWQNRIDKANKRKKEVVPQIHTGRFEDLKAMIERFEKERIEHLENLGTMLTELAGMLSNNQAPKDWTFWTALEAVRHVTENVSRADEEFTAYNSMEDWYEHDRAALEKMQDAQGQ